MKKSLMAILTTMVMSSMLIGAASASYIPDDVSYQNINGQQLAVKIYTLLPDQDPAALMENEFENDGTLYKFSDIIKEEQHYDEVNEHTETVTITTKSKKLEDILAELEPTIAYDDGTWSGTLALDHDTIKTEAAGYQSSSYTVTATKTFTGLASNDSSLIDKTAMKDGRTLSLSNIAWSVESTALVGDELVPATYSAVATYTASASTSVATGYITTADYIGKVTSSGISSIRYTVTYLGTPIEVPEEPETMPTPLAIVGFFVAFGAGVLLFCICTSKNTTVYQSTGNGNEFDRCGRLRIKSKNPVLNLDKLRDVPSGMIAVEIDAGTARKLFGKTISVVKQDRTFQHIVDKVDGQYWFKLDLGDGEQVLAMAPEVAE